MTNKRWVLLKDLPGYYAGTVFMVDNYGSIVPHDETIGYGFVSISRELLLNKKWFAEERWKPGDKDYYRHINISRFGVSVDTGIWRGDAIDWGRHKNNNCFPCDTTEAEEKAEKIHKVLRGEL